MSKNFALIGASGYIAPRHMRAIKDTNNTLVAAYDPYDGIGIMDSYFPEAHFFTQIEIFDRFLDIFKKDSGQKIDYISIASPNYLHDSHIRFALKNGSDAICEKPLVLDVKDIEMLEKIEKESAKKVYTILQLRLHDSIIALKQMIEKELKVNPERVYDIELTYITSRGRWYFESWKGDEAKSGGIASNIGVHFFDMLSWIFGELEQSVLHVKQSDTNAGFMRLKNANVKWFLSVDYENIPSSVKEDGKRTFRSITVDGEEFEFSEGFTDLHTKSYEHILSGRGFGLEDAKSSIEIVSHIRKATVVKEEGEFHPYCKKVIK